MMAPDVGALPTELIEQLIIGIRLAFLGRITFPRCHPICHKDIFTDSIKSCNW